MKDVDLKMSVLHLKAWIKYAIALAIVFVSLLCVQEGNFANAAVDYAMPLNGLKMSEGYSGFIPNRVISESSNTAAHLSQDYVSTTGDWNVMAIYAGTVIEVRNSLSDGAGR